MTFACPGGCKKSHPLAAGQLIIEHQRRQNHGHGYTRNAAQPVVVVLCGPCTAKLVVARAKVRT